MSANAALWAFSLAPDVQLEERESGVVLNSTTGSIRLRDHAQADLARLLACGAESEAALCASLGAELTPDQGATTCAAVLFRLDRIGFLRRVLMQDTHSLAACVPHRAPSEGLPAALPDQQVRMSSQALLHPRPEGGFGIEVPGNWARIDLLDPRLGRLIFELAVGGTAPQIASRQSEFRSGLSSTEIDGLLRLMAWCGLFEESPIGAAAVHEALFQSRTRTGFRRARTGKTGTPLVPKAMRSTDKPQIMLPVPDRMRLIQGDPPHGLVAQRRRSRRQQGTLPIGFEHLSEFLFRCLIEQDGRRPYPSGGSIYPLTAYLVVHRCTGLAPGLYSYDAHHHGLSKVAENGKALKRLLVDAATAADRIDLTQVLIVFAADMTSMRAAYGDLAYGLVLKEVGALFQTALLAGAAMDLAVCPLGTGNSVTFATVTGHNLSRAPSVGELMVGSLG